ncbi:MAG: hypothetical protein IPK80_18180 [Nannocystis sp.]|nr:hypothetical protein [Nannocystis sp.]
MLHRLRGLRPSIFLFGAFVALPACGQIAYEELPAEQVDALCDYMVRCGFATDEGLCAAAWGQFIRPDPNLDAAIEDGSVEYDAKAAEQCLEDAREAACGGIFFEDAPSGACEKVFVGTIANGDACWIDEQCVSQTCQVADCAMACCQGVCVAPPPDAAIGGDCSVQDCVSGAYCEYNFDDGSYTCQAQKGAGVECFGDYECSGSLGCFDGSCQVAPAEGAPCLGGRCGGALGCDITSNTCQKLRGEGQSCEPAASLCAFGLACSTASMKCEAPSGVGSACSFDSGCSDAWCDYDFDTGAGTCQPRLANGAACEFDDSCQSLYCAEGLCGPEAVCVQ